MSPPDSASRAARGATMLSAPAAAATSVCTRAGFGCGAEQKKCLHCGGHAAGQQAMHPMGQFLATLKVRGLVKLARRLRILLARSLWPATPAGLGPAMYTAPSVRGQGRPSQAPGYPAPRKRHIQRLHPGPPTPRSCDGRAIAKLDVPRSFSRLLLQTLCDLLQSPRPAAQVIGLEAPGSAVTPA